VDVARTRVRFGRIALLAAALFGVATSVGRGEESAAVTVASRPYVVHAGDTLWEIARHRVGPGGDPRPVVRDIREVNGLHSAALTPGKMLLLP
jgi:LysM domain-containing protein